MRIMVWSSDVCSSDLSPRISFSKEARSRPSLAWPAPSNDRRASSLTLCDSSNIESNVGYACAARSNASCLDKLAFARTSSESRKSGRRKAFCFKRSEEHTSELQSLMRISYAVFCLKKKRHIHNHQHHHILSIQ